MKDYPHIRDTVYPDLDTVDVYKIENKFDYSRWGVGTQVKLCNVLFNADYSDVVKFDDASARDAYFDNLDGRIVVLQTSFQQVPRDAIKIPIPYDSAIRYNYLCIDIPTPTSDKQPIDYVAADRAKRFYFFITDIEQLAPNTSKVSIALDVWNTYIYDVSIPYLMLERGHAPVATTDVDKYLANPIAHSRYLLAPDVNYGDVDTSKSMSWHPIGNGRKYVCFATTYSYAQLQDVVFGTDAETTSGATYADAAGRAGYRMTVNDYVYGLGGVDFADASLPVQAYNVGYNASVPSLYTYAIDCTSARAFFDLVSRRAPHLMQTIQACFVLGDDVVSLYDATDIEGYTIYKVQPRRIVEGIALSRDMFGYDDTYSRFAKLYTYPYAQLEISDNNGQSFVVRVEDCDNTAALQITLNLAYPYMEYQVTTLGVSGSGYESYRWGTIDGSTRDADLTVADFAQYMLKWDVPTFALFERGYDAYRLNNYWAMKLARANAITNYESSQRVANVTDANTHDTNDTNVANTANSQNTNVANVALSRTYQLDNVNNSNAANSQMVFYSNRMAAESVSIDQTLMRATLESNNELMRVQNMTSQMSNGVNAVAGAVGSALTGNIAGAVMAVGSGIMNAVSTDMNYNASIQANAAVEGAQETNMHDKYISSTVCNTATRDETADLNTDNTTNSLNAARDQAANNRTMANTNANNSANTSNSNADYTRNAQQLANAAGLTMAQREQIYGYRGHTTDANVQIGSYGGDATLDARERRGVSVRVKTQRASDIAQTAAQFARYGYNLNQVWDMTDGFNLMRNFTYWKAADVWVRDDAGTPNDVQLELQTILEQGVTVWRDPAKIGGVSVYDN